MIHFRGLCVCAAVLACSVTSASATVRIVEDHGGEVGKYLHAFAKVRSTGERVIACLPTRWCSDWSFQANLRDTTRPLRFPCRLDAQ